MTRKENSLTVNNLVNNDSEIIDKEHILKKYIELNEECDKILTRIRKENKKQSTSNRSKING